MSRISATLSTNGVIKAQILVAQSFVPLLSHRLCGNPLLDDFFFSIY
jgi:hypothetical protein